MTHGIELKIFNKDGQFIKVMADGCLIIELPNLAPYVLTPDHTGHTIARCRYYKAITEKDLESSGYVEGDIF